MIEYFLGWEKNSVAPTYLENAVLPYTLKNVDGSSSNKFDSMILSSWPCARELGLDSNQHQAFCTALTSRVALIQGPPGTGKTFLALKIVDSLLDNKELWQGEGGPSENKKLLTRLRSVNSNENINWRLKNKFFWKSQGEYWLDERTPIVVICFTVIKKLIIKLLFLRLNKLIIFFRVCMYFKQNHALDQFLEEILQSTTRVIRIGGQSKSPVLEQYNLNQVKIQARDTHLVRPYTESSYFHFFYKMKEVRAVMEVLIRSIQSKIRNMYAENLKISDLKRRHVITAEICDVFDELERTLNKRKGKKVNVLKWWLGWENHRQLLKIMRQKQMCVRSYGASLGSNQLTEDEKPNDERNPEEDMEDITDHDAHHMVSDADLIDDVVDAEYFNEELPQAMELIEDPVLNVKDDSEDIEDSPVRLDCPEQVDQDERALIDFANNQLQRMQLIRDYLLSMPSAEDEDDFGMALEYVEASEILSLPLNLRWLMYCNWKKRLQNIVSQELRDAEVEYEARIKEYNELKGLALAALCRTADVIGMTTTGAAKNRLLLESLNAKIGNLNSPFIVFISVILFLYAWNILVIVEEAAEVLESHIVCSLTSECQQLIMIGNYLNGYKKNILLIY